MNASNGTAFRSAKGYLYLELGLLKSNPVPALKWTAPKTVNTVDRRSVANPVQVRTLLAAVRVQQRSGPPHQAVRHGAGWSAVHGGVPPTTVAEWAGHSVEILHKIYAKCLDGEAASVRQRDQAALGHKQG